MSYQPYREKTYVVTSVKFQGSLTLVYDGLGNLRRLTDETNMSDAQRRYLGQNFPVTSFQLPALKGDSTTLIIQEVKQDLSFRTFWNAYNHKVGNKGRCQQLWEKLTDADKLKCLNGLRRYQDYLIRTQTRKAYPETYLVQRRFDND